MTTDSSDLPPVARLLEDGAWLQALARSVVADHATADDVAQDAALVALTKPPREAGALRGWLRRVVRNLATDARRGAVRREALEAACAKREAEDDAADLAARWEIRRQVVDAVLALDEPYRATLLLRFFEGLDPAETAARQRVPLDTVKTRQRRALDMLRARLAHLDDRAGGRRFVGLFVLARPGVGTGGLAMSAVSKSVVVALLVGLAAGALIDRGLLSATSAASDVGATAATPTPSAAAGAGRPRPPVSAERADAALPPASAAPAAAAPNDEDVRARVVQTLSGLDGDWRKAYAAGEDLAKLDARTVVEVLRERWSGLTEVSDRQQLLKAFQQQRPPHQGVLEVLDLGMEDAAPAVQNWAALCLRSYSGRSFIDDWPSYRAWRERTSGRDPAAVVRSTLRELLGRVRSATPDELAMLAPLLRDVARTAGADDVAAAGAPDALALWIARVPAKELSALLEVVGAARPDEDCLRRIVVPLLTDPDAERRDAAFRFFALDKGRDAWAVDVLSPLLRDADPRTAVGAARALGGIGDARAVAPLLESLRARSSPETADAAGAALAKIAGVAFDRAHDAAWWNAWLTKNGERFRPPR